MKNDEAAKLIMSMGQWWRDPHGEVRVMTVCEGYVMARRPGAAPFVKSASNFMQEFRHGKGGRNG